MGTKRTFESFPSRDQYEAYLRREATKHKSRNSMTNAQYSDLVQAAGKIRSAVLNKEMGDDGWDLRDELLALQELVSQLATAIHQNHYIAYEPVRPSVDPRQVRLPERRQFDPNIYEDEDD